MTVFSRWAWLQRTDPTKTRALLPAVQEKQVTAMVEASLLVNGTNALFWTDKWLDGRSIKWLAPNLFMAIPQKTTRTRMVKEALHLRRWARDITGAMTWQVTREYLSLWRCLRDIILDMEADRFIWKWTGSGDHLFAATYATFFRGREYMDGGR